MKTVKEDIQKQINKMSETMFLFRSNISGDRLWDAYMKGFGNDPVFIDPNSSVHNCNYCKSFIRRYGNIVTFDNDGNIMTIWDNCSDDEYKESFKNMSKLLKSGHVQDIFIESFDFLEKVRYEVKPKKDQLKYQLGIPYNIKRYTEDDITRHPNCSKIKLNDTRKFEHLSMLINSVFVNQTNESIESIMGKVRSKVQVLIRGLQEISIDTLELVRDLEAQGSLLNGNSYKHFIDGAIKLKKAFDETSNKEMFIWTHYNDPAAGFRNTAIGTLIVDLSEGREINEAVKAFNKIVDPVNYMKAKSPITKKQIAEAEKFVEDNEYAESFERRCATIDDINISEILHSNMSSTIKKVSIFDKVKPTRHKKSEFDNVEEVGIDKFMSDILPTCTSVELYLTAKHEKNFVNLLTSVNKDSKGMFKWNNNFSWTYNGNLAGKSEIATAVKEKGGCVDAPLRCSIIWNESGDAMCTDLDNHCDEKRDASCFVEDHIYYANHRYDRNQSASMLGGYLDIDITNPSTQCNGGPGIENIFYPDYKDGIYNFFIMNFNGGDNIGARAEIEFEGEVYQYKISHRLNQNQEYRLAKLTIKNHKLVKIEQSQYFVGTKESADKNIYGLDTNQFHKVNLMCLSPNYWQEQGVGNKHYFFMLEGAQNPDEIRSIHNEFLNDELRNHRKVMEVLGSTLRVESTKGQLCGLGFNSTVRDEVILRLGGSFKRVIKVKF